MTGGGQYSQEIAFVSWELNQQMIVILKKKIKLKKTIFASQNLFLNHLNGIYCA